MGTYREAAPGRRFAPRWQIVLLNELIGPDFIRTVVARFSSISAVFSIFTSLWCQAHRNGDVVYASLFHWRVGREARLTRRIAYTTIG
jgi:hypothetical protein